ncbi:MAG: glycoside hydrolase family protein [Novosphingobium sp.]
MAEPLTPGGATGRLLALLGAASMTALLTLVPLEESGRRVEVTVTGEGATIRHVSGRQYLKAYLDAVGVATACDGITRGVKLGQTYTEAQCSQMLILELLETAQRVKACSPGLFLPGWEGARVAAVSLAYNIGYPRFCTSTANKWFRAGQLSRACDAFLLWNKGRVKGVLTVLPGLKARRERERKLCLGGL